MVLSNRNDEMKDVVPALALAKCPEILRFVKEVCNLCAQICRACGDERSKHSMDYCKECAEACYTCADACQRVAACPSARRRRPQNFFLTDLAPGNGQLVRVIGVDCLPRSIPPIVRGFVGRSQIQVRRRALRGRAKA